jgi:hypothetical protein
MGEPTSLAVNGVVFSGDNYEGTYNMIRNGVRLIKGVPGLTCEIGIRRGLSSVSIMNGCQLNDDRRIHVGIDPWGNIPYTADGGRSDYTNAMKRETLKDLYHWCYLTEQEFLMFIMTDQDFFQRFADGIPVYRDNREMINQYAYVYFDGPKEIPEAAFAEVKFFEARAPIGAVWQFDDTDFYDHDSVDRWILGHGFEDIEELVGNDGDRNCKRSYRRIA